MEQNSYTLYDKLYDKIDDLTFCTHSEIASVARSCEEISKEEAIRFADFTTGFIATRNGNTGEINWYDKHQSMLHSTSDLYTLFKQQNP